MEQTEIEKRKKAQYLSALAGLGLGVLIGFFIGTKYGRNSVKW